MFSYFYFLEGWYAKVRGWVFGLQISVSTVAKNSGENHTRLDTTLNQRVKGSCPAGGENTKPKWCFTAQGTS